MQRQTKYAGAFLLSLNLLVAQALATLIGIGIGHKPTGILPGFTLEGFVGARIACVPPWTHFLGFASWCATVEILIAGGPMVEAGFHLSS